MREYDLIVVGGGSGNMIFGPEFDDWRRAIVEEDRIGGTCLHRGCVPSKMLVVAADVATTVREASRYQVAASFDGVDWPALRDRIFDRLDPTHASAVDYRERTGTDVFPVRARFIAPRVLDVGGEQITARHIVAAVGSRPALPPIRGLDDVPFHTSDTIMRIDALPRSMIIVGGGFIAAEMGHVFSAFGVDVTIVQRSPRLLMAEDDDISARFTELARGAMHVETDSEVVAVRQDGAQVVATVRRHGERSERSAEMLLVATGRVPNSDRIDAAAGGLAVDEHGHVVVDDHYRTNVEGVWAFGDVANHTQLKHMANAEMRVVAHNLAHPDDLRSLGTALVPHAVFSHPQIAAVGLAERAARSAGLDVVVASQDYGGTAYGWALEDTTSFAKVIIDARDHRIIGAHVIGHEASLLLQPLLQAMMLGNTAEQVARGVLYVHPALTEVIEQALLAALEERIDDAPAA